MHKDNIILVGFMGTGKSTVGKRLATQLGRELVDMDAMIEQREDRAISDIFATDGQAYFRSLEKNMVNELAGKKELVITPGGGIVLDWNNIERFASSGMVVCLQASPKTILDRVQHETHRPLLEDGDKLQKINTLLSEREALYARVPYQVHTDGLTPDDITGHILEIYHSRSAA